MADFVVSFPGLNLNHLEIHRIAFKFSVFGLHLTIYWYGILIALAFLLGGALALRQARRYGFDPERLSEAFLFVVPGALVGARLYYVAFSWSLFADNIWRVFDTRSGGLAFYGGVIGGAIGLLIWARWRKQRLSCVLDFIVVYLPLGQAIGRWGNFFNQEAFGGNTLLPWGMLSTGTIAYLQRAQIPGTDPMLPVHPTFLYEFLANMLIFVILLIVRRHQRRPWTTVSLYLILYGVVRYLVEGLRTDALFIGSTSLRVSQLLSLVMIALGLVVLGTVRARRLTRTWLVLDGSDGHDMTSGTVSDGCDGETRDTSGTRS